MDLKRGWNDFIYFYYVFNGKLSVGDYVIVNTDRGEQLVKVVDIITKDDISEYESIERIANESEYNEYLENLRSMRGLVSALASP